MPSKNLMNLFRRIFIANFVLLVAISSFGYFFWYKPVFNKRSSGRSLVFKNELWPPSREVLSRLRLKASSAKGYIKAMGFNANYCFLLDMHIYPGQKRFFVYNLKKDSVELAGLVTHGSGSQASGNLVFSNKPNSNCTSLGRYKIGKPYNGTFGLAYKLYGLDESNDNAFERYVVLHGHECVPDEEVYPLPICLSLGCPTVSPPFLTMLKGYIDQSNNPVLLWIYY